MKCEKCGYDKNKDEAEYCFSCGEKLSLKKKSKRFIDGSLAANQPKTKICEYCRTEVPFEAEVCPNCRRTLSVGRKLINGLQFIVIIIIITIVVLFTLSQMKCEVEFTPQKSTEKNINNW